MYIEMTFRLEIDDILDIHVDSIKSIDAFIQIYQMLQRSTK